jgi:membrane-associated protease RseP (regulator of RpoE activity)
MRNILAISILGVLGAASCPRALADDPSQKQAGPSAIQRRDTNNESASAAETQAYLGVGVHPLPSSLVAQLSDLIGGDYGVMVDEVAGGSPAATAGLKADDVCYRYDDQKLFSGEQLVRLVRGDKPGREVTLSIIRNLKPQTIKVTLGERRVTSAARSRTAFRRPLEESTRSSSRDDRESGWRPLDGISLMRVDENRFRAEIRYRDERGRVETRTFQGTRDQIHKDIDALKDRPASERDHLLHVLDMLGRSSDVDLPENNSN